jgi:hypothetical protein
MEKEVGISKDSIEHRGVTADFGLRNWEPARRVGVRRTIADLKNRRQ